MTPEQLKQLAIQEKTQVNIRLPSGEIIPAGINPGEAATLDVFSALTANRQVNVQNAPQLSSALTQVGIQQLGGLPQQPQDPGGVQYLFGRNEQIPELGQILGVSAQRPGLTAGGGAEDIAKQFRGVRPVTDTFQNPNKDFFSSQQTPLATTVARPSPTAIQDLQGSVAITAIEKRIDDIASRLSAGIAAGGAEEILEGLFERFDIKSETDLLNSYNQIILEKTQQLRSLPEDIQKSLEDVGVSEGQLNRLVQKESQKPLEVLRDLMELKGVAQERIDQSLKFVGLFADAQMQDKAAKLEALTFELELAQGKFEDLREDQKELVKQGIDDKKKVLELMLNHPTAGITSEDTLEEAVEKTTPFLKQQEEIATAQDIAPGIANQIAGMSDSQALQFVQQQATKFGVGVDALLNAVEAEEAKKSSGGDGTGDKILSINQIAEFRRSYGWTPPYGFTSNQLLQYMEDNPNATPEELEAGAKLIGQEGSENTESAAPARSNDEIIDDIMGSITDDQLKALKADADRAGVSSMFKPKTVDVKNYLKTVMPEFLSEGYTEEEIIAFFTS